MFVLGEYVMQFLKKLWVSLEDIKLCWPMRKSEICSSKIVPKKSSVMETFEFDRTTGVKLSI